MSLTDEILEVIRQTVPGRQMARNIWTGSAEVLKRSIAPHGFDPASSKGNRAPTFGGVPVIQDPRVPHGVWALVPPGADLVDATEVGFIGPEYAEAATAFANALNAARGFQLSPTI